MKIKTKLTKVGRNSKKTKGYINPGVYKGSTIVFNNYREYLDEFKRDDYEHFYGIQKNPISIDFENAISELYESNDSVLVSSGLTAVIIPFLTFLKKGDHVLVSDSLYNPTRTFCNDVLYKFGIEVEYFNPINDINKLNIKLKKNTKMFFLESPATSTFEITDIPKITSIAKKRNIITVADNTWASIIFCNPLKLGVNIVIEAITKYVNGHSDVLLGIISSDKKHSKKIRKFTKTMGICVGPDDVYLALRGLPTLELRIKQIEKNALLLAKELYKHQKIKNVFHPALPSHPTHKIWKRDFSGSSGLFSFELNKKYNNSIIEKFFKKLNVFKLGYSFGGFESLITFPTIEKRKINNFIKGNIIRIYCGLEDYEDQKKDIINALKVL